MSVELENRYGRLMPLPNVKSADEINWHALAPTPQATADVPKDGIEGNRYCSKDHNFAISIPGDEWWFWRPTLGFLLTLGPMMQLPTVSAPIVIFSKQFINLFRPNVVVIVENVGQYTNIRQLFDASLMQTKPPGITFKPADLEIDDTHQSAMLNFTRQFPDGAIHHTTQLCYLMKGKSYTITATYVPNPGGPTTPFSSLQEILNSFEFLKD